ncbi:MAG: hypothetical protein H7Y18_13765 [Clostridiaceae bacterium]|nr:hypothetical protein [Clostridiaceae bacterium]
MLKKKTYSIDAKVAKDFEEYCNRNSINMSKWLQNRMSELILNDYKK